MAPLNKHFQNPDLCQMLSKLKTVLCFYTVMINKIMVTSQKEVLEDY